jgi:transcriptional regulator with XRE-family HTH domain
MTVDAEKLKELLHASGLTYEAFGKRMGVSKQYVSLLVNGDRRITPTFASKATPFLRKAAHARMRQTMETLESLNEDAQPVGA